MKNNRNSIDIYDAVEQWVKATEAAKATVHKTDVGINWEPDEEYNDALCWAAQGDWTKADGTEVLKFAAERIIFALAANLVVQGGDTADEDELYQFVGELKSIAKDTVNIMRPRT